MQQSTRCRTSSGETIGEPELLKVVDLRKAHILTLYVHLFQLNYFKAATSHSLYWLSTTIRPSLHQIWDGRAEWLVDLTWNDPGAFVVVHELSEKNRSGFLRSLCESDGSFSCDFVKQNSRTVFYEHSHEWRPMSTIPRTSSLLWSMGMEICIGDAFRQKRQDNCTTLRGRMWPCIVRYWVTLSFLQSEINL